MAGGLGRVALADCPRTTGLARCSLHQPSIGHSDSLLYRAAAVVSTRQTRPWTRSVSPGALLLSAVLLDRWVQLSPGKECHFGDPSLRGLVCSCKGAAGLVRNQLPDSIGHGSRGCA